MTGPTDPALRALKDEVEALRYKYEPGSVSAAYENGWYDGRGAALQVIYDRLAAAEAAPLDNLCSPYYERGWKAGKAAAEAAPLDVETVKTALVVLPPPENMDAYVEEVTARLNAALRTPDTEEKP
jgi:hypothetical protein